MLAGWLTLVKCSRNDAEPMFEGVSNPVKYHGSLYDEVAINSKMTAPKPFQCVITPDDEVKDLFIRHFEFLGDVFASRALLSADNLASQKFGAVYWLLGNRTHALLRVPICYMQKTSHQKVKTIQHLLYQRSGTITKHYDFFKLGNKWCFSGFASGLIR